MTEEEQDFTRKSDNFKMNNFEARVRKESECNDEEKIPITTTTTKNALTTSHLGECEEYPHRLKVSILGSGRIAIACAIAILMRRIASEVCLIDKHGEKASAEAEDIRHAGIFLGNPLITGTSDFTKVKDSTVVIIATCERKVGEQEPNVKHNLETFKIIVPAIAKFACKAVLLVVTQPVDVMSYITWKLSKFPSNRVIGTGTTLDTARFQKLLSQKLGLAPSSVNCMSIGAQGSTSVSVWSGVHVAGMRLRDINPRIGEKDDPEKWHEISEAVKSTEIELDQRKGEKGPSCWALGLCTAEIVDAIIRNTKVVLPASTYIRVHLRTFAFCLLLILGWKL